jgi:hypothetical protein
LPQRLHPVDQFVDLRSEPLVARQSHYLALRPSRSAGAAVCQLRLGDRPTKPDQAAPCGAGSLPSAGTITVAAPPSNPILASTIR